MRVSKLFGETLRNTPGEADTISHQLLLRAGYVRQLAAGIFSYLPLAWRSVKKIEQILIEEMDAIGGQQISMPVVHPAEIWQQSGRWEEIDETMARFRDRRGRDMLLAMTHEEAVATLANSEVHSYKQLPLLLYQIQTKFRDELRPRGGLIRVREFIMKDSYSLDRDLAGLRKQYAAHYNAYFRIAARVQLPLIAVRSDVGMMGGKMAHEFMYLSPIGEDRLAICQGCGYAANLDVAGFVKEPLTDLPEKPLEKVATPGTSTIDTLCDFLGIEKHQTAKVVFYTAGYRPAEPQKLIICVVRGDMEVNETRIMNLSGARQLRAAEAPEIQAVGCVPGFASPIGIKGEQLLVIADDLIPRSRNLVTGANEKDCHFLNSNCRRDYDPDIIDHIVLVYEGAPCQNCAQPLEISRGVEVGNIFQLGTRYSEGLNARFLDEQGRAHPLLMGSYGIGVGRLLACVAEEHHDEQGLCLPVTVAPYQVALIQLKGTNTTETAETLYNRLTDSGIEVLYDDREVSPGIKFTDADLRGMPLRLTVSERSLKNGGIELKHRRRKQSALVPLEKVTEVVGEEIAGLQRDIRKSLEGVETWRESGD